MRWLKHRKLLLSAFALLLLCLLLPSCYPPVACAKTYQITEAELTTLEQNLARLEQNSKSKQALLQTQSEKLKKLEELLNQSLQQNEETQNSLANAEASLKQYEQEQKHKQAVKERQRNVWIAIAGIATAWAIVK